MSSCDKGQIGEVLDRFLVWSRQMGWVYDMMPTYMTSFERFVESRAIETLDQIDTPLLVDYQRHLQTSKSASTVNCHMGALRALWRFLLREELVTKDVMAGVDNLPRDHFVPYIYNVRELHRIDQALKQAIWKAHTTFDLYNRWTWRTAFGLLRDCGLRVSEACRLDMSHFDQNKRTLRIERTKFFKTRVIPIPQSTCLELERYLQLRHGLRCLKGDNQAFFVSTHGRRASRVTLEHQWKDVLSDLGLYRARRRQGHTVFGSTNLHALRHGFAVGRLEKWHRQGMDVESLLPLLSAYMGHVKVSYTMVYLHLTPTLRQMASERFGKMALPLLDRSGAGLLGEDPTDEEKNK